MNRGTVIMLEICVAKTPAAASWLSPPNLLIKMGVVDADGIADCRTMMARASGERKPHKPVIKSARPGTSISLHNTISKIGFL